MITQRLTTICTSLACLALVACGAERKPVAAPITTIPDLASETTTTSVTMTPVTSSVSVSEQILRNCKLQLDDTSKAPKFEFDESHLLSSDYEILGKVGRCFKYGPLSNATLKLVGHADPRGTTDYNMALGARRAHRVRVFLETYGIDGDRLVETSRGELDATGVDENGWQVDRRVDLVLAD